MNFNCFHSKSRFSNFETFLYFDTKQYMNLGKIHTILEIITILPLSFYIYKFKTSITLKKYEMLSPSITYFFKFTQHSKPFSEWVLAYPKTKIQDYLQLSSEEKSEIINNLTLYVIKEPVIEINESCKRQIQMSTNCSDYPAALYGERGINDRKPKIAHLIQYGFETDVLEIILSEIYDFVDKFFIVESQVTHFKNVKKPLVWPLLSKQKRFQPYIEKIVYFNLSSEMIENYASEYDLSKDNIWRNENIQERLRFKLFLDWNKENDDYFKDDDIVGFGDTDEIPSFHNLILMKKCFLKGTTDIGIWFTHSQINKHWISDFPVRGYRDTFGDPTYWSLKDAIKNGFPSRKRGKSPFFLLGGIHLTRYGYLPSMILKDLTMTEYEGGSKLLKLREYLENDMSLYDATKKIFFNDRCRKDPRNIDLDENKLNCPPYMIPWIMQCNPLRYPSFLKEFPPDNRLD